MTPRHPPRRVRLCGLALLVVLLLAPAARPAGAYVPPGAQAFFVDPRTRSSLFGVQAGATPFEISLTDSSVDQFTDCDYASAVYQLFTYFVPRGTDISTLTFTNRPSTGYGLFDVSGTYVGGINSTGSGSIATRFVLAGALRAGIPLDGPGGLIPSGSTAVWEAGIACTDITGQHIANYWNNEVTLERSTTDPDGFTWRTVPGGGYPSLDFGSAIGWSGLTTTTDEINITASAVDAQGRLLIAARGLTTGRHLVARLRPDGLPDTTFGNGGVATIPAAASYMSVGDDGRIALAWPSQVGADVTVLDANGIPVPDFGVDGVAHVAGTGHVRTMTALAVLGSTVYVALATDLGWLEPHQVAVTALDSSGVPETAFGDGGVAAFPPSTFGGTFNGGVDLAARGRGLYLCAGARLIALDRNGAPDPTFAGTGVLGTRMVDATGCLITVLSNGDVLFATEAPFFAPRVCVLSPDGRPRTGFEVPCELGPGTSRSTARLVPLGDGSVLGDSNGTYVRFMPDGRQEQYFAGDGSFTVLNGVVGTYPTGGTSAVVALAGRAGLMSLDFGPYGVESRYVPGVTPPLRGDPSRITVIDAGPPPLVPEARFPALLLITGALTVAAAFRGRHRLHRRLESGGGHGMAVSADG